MSPHRRACVRFSARKIRGEKNESIFNELEFIKYALAASQKELPWIALKKNV